MPRIVALDVGDATIGVAASDELGITANPVETIRRTASVKADLRTVEELLARLDAGAVVVGVPITLSGEVGPQALKVMDFVERLRKRLRIPVKTIDEALTTVDAESALIESGISRRKRRKVIDKMAAAVILDSYLRSTE